MSSFGVTNEGFVKKTFTTILDEIETDQRDTIQQELDQQADQTLGQINGIVASKVEELWNVGEGVYSAQYPDSASGVALDNVGAITGAIRKKATKSTVSLDVTLDPGTTLTVGRVVSQSVTGVRFTTTAEVTNGGGVPAVFAVAAESEDTGPIAATAATLTVIETPVAGWTAVTNPLDAVLGATAQTDSQFREFRNSLLALRGSATVEAIRADLLVVPGVTAVTVFENYTSVTDVDGLPPKSIECVVLGGTDQDVGDALWLTKGAGIEPYGGSSPVVVMVVDSQGFTQTVRFSRPTEVEIYADITVTTDSNYPLDGDDQVKAALVAAGALLTTGEDVIFERIKAAAFTVSGVVDVTSFTMDTVDGSSGTVNIPIASRELAVFDTTRIDVTS